MREEDRVSDIKWERQGMRHWGKQCDSDRGRQSRWYWEKKIEKIILRGEGKLNDIEESCDIERGR